MLGKEKEMGMRGKENGVDMGGNTHDSGTGGKNGKKRKGKRGERMGKHRLVGVLRR